MFYTVLLAGNLPHKVAHNRPHDAHLAHLYFKVGGDRHHTSGEGSGLPDVRVTAGTLRIFYENMPEEHEVCLKCKFDVRVLLISFSFAQSEIVNGSYAELEEEEEAANETMIQNHEKYRVTVSWIKRGIHKGMLDSRPHSNMHHKNHNIPYNLCRNSPAPHARVRDRAPLRPPLDHV